MVIIRTLVFLLVLAMPAWSATFYFADDGNDGGNCTDINAPCKTLSKANGLSWAAGNKFLFKCGDTFRGTGNGALSAGGNGASGNPITISHYGTCPDMDSYPVLTQSTLLVGGWTSHATNIWKRTISSYAAGEGPGPNVFFNRVRPAWREDHDSGCPGSMTRPLEICYSSARTTLYVRTTAGNPNNLNAPGVEIMTSGGTMVKLDRDWIVWDGVNIKQVSNHLGMDGSVGNIIIKNSQFTDSCYRDKLGLGKGGNFGCWSVRTYQNVSSNKFITFDNNYIRGCGRDCIDIDRGLPDGEIRITNNTWHAGYNHGAFNLAKDTDPDKSIEGPGARATGLILIQGNTVYDTCGMIGFGDGDDGSFSNLRIIGNTLHSDAPYPPVADPPDYQVKEDPPGSTRQCQGPNPSINTVGNDSGANTIYVANNIIYNVSMGMRFKGSGPHNLKIYNNTIYDTSPTGGIWLQEEISGEIKNNAFILNDDSSLSASPGGSIQCEPKAGGSSTCDKMRIDYNYFLVNNSSNYVGKWMGSGQQTLAGMRSNFPTQWGANNIVANYGSNPTLFVNAGAGNFTPAANSPLINKGVNVGIAFVGSAPDIGAIESGAPPEPPPEGNPPSVLSARVEALTPSTLTVLFAADTLPMLPATNCHAGWSLSGATGTITGCTRTATNTFTFTLSAAMVVTDIPFLSYNPATGATTDSTSPTPLELETLTDYSVANLAGNSLVTAGNISATTGTFAAGREATKLFDGDITNEAGTAGNGGTLQFSVTNDLGTVKPIGLTRLYGDNALSWQCSTYTIEYATDNPCTTWCTARLALPCNGNQWWEQSLEEINTRCLRLTVNGPAAGVQAREWAVYEGTDDPEEPPPPPPPPPPMEELPVPSVIGTSVTGTEVR